MTERLWRCLPIGRSDSSPFGSDNDSLEEIRWIGKPWRRIELLTNRYFYKGEQIEAIRDLTFHIGSRRLGVFATVILSRNRGFAYEDEPL